MNATMHQLTESVDSLFAPGTARPDRIGAELEWLPVARLTRRPMPIIGASGTLRLSALAGADVGWAIETDSKGMEFVRAGDAGVITFEPGGQIEFSAVPAASVSAVVIAIAHVRQRLADTLGEHGIDLVTSGMDAETPAGDAPIFLESERYRRMAAYFASTGSAGARMMRQTASLQIALDWGDDSVRALRWTAANALAAVLAAMFANAPVAEGRVTPFPSARAMVWRELDPDRTGLAWGPDARRAYLDFALNAKAFLLGPAGAPARPFRAWLSEGVAMSDWETHLTTLFPEVRPRGYLELRTADAVDVDSAGAAMAFVALLMTDASSLTETLALTGEPSESTLQRASSLGLRDPAIRQLCGALAHVAIRLAGRGGCPLVDDDAAGLLERFLERYTLQGRSPADDVLAGLATA